MPTDLNRAVQNLPRNLLSLSEMITFGIPWNLCQVAPKILANPSAHTVLVVGAKCTILVRRFLDKTASRALNRWYPDANYHDRRAGAIVDMLELWNRQDEGEYKGCKVVQVSSL